MEIDVVEPDIALAVDQRQRHLALAEQREGVPDLAGDMAPVGKQLEQGRDPRRQPAASGDDDVPQRRNDVDLAAQQPLQRVESREALAVIIEATGNGDDMQAVGLAAEVIGISSSNLRFWSR